MNMLRLNRLVVVMTIGAAAFGLAACEDLPPNDYVERYIVEGYLIANHGIDSIFIRRSLPVNQSYDPNTAAIRNAVVTIAVDGQVYTLQEDTLRPDLYYLPASQLIVRSGKTYTLECHMADIVLRGVTTVPDTLHFTQRPPDTLQYPFNPDDANKPAATVAWESVKNKVSYAASVRCTDTLFITRWKVDTTINGRDTTVVRGIRNSRIQRWWEDNAPFYKDATRWAPFIDVTSIPMPWTGFKWYGPHIITVYAVDSNMYDWMRIMLLGGTYRSQLNHIEGGIGVFGSCAIDTAMVFVKK
jgi:hypothetical protein